MGKRLIIKGASFITNAIDTPSTTYYSVTYNLSHCTASNNATTVVAGSSYTVTLTPNSGYTISSAAVTHNGNEVTPTSDYTYTINSVSGNILVECVADEEQVTPVLPKTITQDDWAYSLEDTCYLVDKNGSTGYLSFRSGSNAAGSGFAIIDVEAYRGNTITVVNSSSYTMRTCMFISSFIPTNIPNIMGESYGTSTDVTPYLASGWTKRENVNANVTTTITIPSDAKYFYFTYLSSGNQITYTMTIN